MSLYSRMINNKSVHAYFWLFIGTILWAMSNGNWTVLIASWLAPVFLLRFLRTRKPFSGLIIGAVVVCGVTLLMWLKLVVPFAGYLPSILLTAGCTLYLYLAYVIDRLVSPRLKGFVSTLVFPLAYTSMEYTLSLFNPLKAIMSLAYTQYGNLPLMQLASVTGIYGITFLITWFASVINWTWEGGFSRTPCTKTIRVYGTVFALVFLLGGARLEFSVPNDSTVRIASITRSPYYSSQLDEATYLRDKQLVSIQLRDHLLELSMRAAKLGARIVFWQEYAVPFVEDESAFIEPGRELARSENIYLGMSYSTIFRNDRGEPAGPNEPVIPPENKIVMIEPSGEIAWEYAKANPAFGELIVPGDGTIHNQMTPYGRIASVICFDLESPDYIRQAGIKDVDILLVPAFDWPEIGSISTRPVAFRAIENGLSVIRATGEGHSIAVDYFGRTRSTVNYFATDDHVMIADLPTSSIQTLYSIIGDLFAWIFIAAFIVVTSIAFIRKPSS